MRPRIALFAALVVSLSAPRADAALVTYTFDGTLTGTLGGTAASGLWSGGGASGVTRTAPPA